MNWDSAADFFAMGGYGRYVWGSYLLTAVALAWEPWSIARRQRRAATEARAAIEAERPD